MDVNVDACDLVLLVPFEQAKNVLRSALTSTKIIVSPITSNINAWS